MGQPRIWIRISRARRFIPDRESALLAQSIPPPRAWVTRSPAVATATDEKSVRANGRHGGLFRKETMKTPASPPTLLDPNTRPIDLNTALRLAACRTRS